MTSRVILETNNRNYTGWNKLSVRRSMEEFLGSFAIELVDGGSTSPFGKVHEGDKCKIYVETDERVSDKEIEIFTGRIDSKERTRTGNTTSMTITGSDMAQDLVDCSAIIPSNTWTTATLIKIATDLAKPFDIFVDDYTNPSEPFVNFTIQNGESCFSVIERACRQLGVLPLTNRFGDVVLTYARDASDRAIVDLVDGENIKTITESSQRRGRYSEYILRGQNSGNGAAWDSTTTRLRAKATDSTVNRYRPLVVLAEGKTDYNKLQQRAKWEAQVRAGRSLVHTVSVVDWFIAKAGMSSEKRPWGVNDIVNLISKPMDLETKRLITGVEFQLDPVAGRTTNLELKDPRTYAQNPSPVVDF